VSPWPDDSVHKRAQGNRPAEYMGVGRTPP
jgi:hypothetical protein